jgi:hypothetical protein
MTPSRAGSLPQVICDTCGSEPARESGGSITANYNAASLISPSTNRRVRHTMRAEHALAK